MNFLAGLATGAFGLALMMAMTTLILGKDLPEALLYSCVAAATMFVTFGYMARTVSAEVKGATAQRAADVIAARFKIGMAPLHGGGLRLTGGANFFWAPVDVTPTVHGVILRGPGNIVAFMKAQLAKP